MFLCSQNSCLELVHVAHCLNQDCIRPILNAKLHHLCIDRDSFLKIEISHRFQKSSGRPQIKRNQSVSGLPNCLVCAVEGSPDNLAQRKSISPDLQPVCSECVGTDNIRSGIQIILMNLNDRIRMQQIPRLRKFPQPDSCFLEHRAHRPIKQDDPFLHHSAYIHMHSCSRVWLTAPCRK